VIAVIVVGSLLWVSDRRFEFGLADNFGRIFPKVAAFVGYAPADG
jgi:hypothetical protein